MNLYRFSNGLSEKRGIGLQCKTQLIVMTGDSHCICYHII